MMSNNNIYLVRELYRFSQLSVINQCKLADTLIEYKEKGNTLGWKNNREDIIIPFLKSYIGYKLTEEESTLLTNKQRKLERVNNMDDLDICLMFWQVTLDPKYMGIIRKEALDITSHVYKPSNIILRYYKQ